MSLVSRCTFIVVLIFPLLSFMLPITTLRAAEMDEPPAAALSMIGHIPDLVTTGIKTAGMAIIVIGHGRKLFAHSSV